MSDVEVRKNRINSSSSVSNKNNETRALVKSRLRSSKVGRSSYSINNIVQEITNKRIKRIVVMVGAGISTLSGIPDFRTPGSGLYDNLKQFKIPYPEAIFELDYFKDNPRPFFTLAKELMPSEKYKPNKIHYFLRLLEEKQLLHRLYTQNIDGLELQAGISPDKLVEAHGTFSSAKCLGCKTAYSQEFIKKAIYSNKIPRCTECNRLVKPNIVFFGEDLPKRFDLHMRDFLDAQLILVMGTSLAVEPFANIVNKCQNDVPRLLLNREAVGPFKNLRRKKDIAILGNLSESIDLLVQMLGWEQDLATAMENLGTPIEVSTSLATTVKVEDVNQQSLLAELFYLDKTNPISFDKKLQPSNEKTPQAIKNSLVERNNNLLGIKSKVLLGKRQQSNGSQNIKPTSGTKFFEKQNLLPPNYNSLRNKTASPFNKEMITNLANRLIVDTKLNNSSRPSKFIANSRPLINASMLNSFKQKRKSSEFSDEDSDDSSSSSNSDN